MKTARIILLVLFLLMLNACQISLGGGDLVRGSGTLATEERAISGVTGVANNTSGDLVIQLGDQEKLTIEAENNLLPSITTTVRNGVLEIGEKPGVILQSTDPIRFTLVVKQLSAISNSSSGDITAPALQAESFFVMVSSSGDVNLEDLQAGTLAATLSSSGDLTIGGGNVRQQVISLVSSGNYQAGDVQSEAVVATLSSSGDATVWATKGLVATLTSSGNVHFYGNPQITLKTTSSGKVDPLGNK